MLSTKSTPFVTALLPFDPEGFEGVLCFLKFGHFSNAFEGMVLKSSRIYLGNGFETDTFDLNVLKTLFL